MKRPWWAWTFPLALIPNMKTPAYQYRFTSSSGNHTYETLQWTDGSLSCDCPGWVRRCVDGKRTCKHVRFVETGVAQTESISHGPVGGGVKSMPAPTTSPVVTKPGFKRKFV